MNKRWLVPFVLALGVFAQSAEAQRNPEFPRDLHGLWWQPADPGWASAVFDHESAMSSVLMTYDYDGTPIWLIAPRLECYRDTQPWLQVGCSGGMYRVTGPSFAEPTFRPEQVRVEAVGEWIGTFTTPLFAGVGPNPQRILSLLYTLDNVTVVPAGDWPMEVQTVDEEAPFLFLDTSKSGLWGNPDENGWGIGLFQQRKRLFATLFVHGPDRRPRWYVVNATVPISDFTSDPLYFEGEIFETRGHPWGRITAERYTARQVGLASVRFGTHAGGGATLTYAIDGVHKTKTIYRVP